MRSSEKRLAETRINTSSTFAGQLGLGVPCSRQGCPRPRKALGGDVGAAGRSRQPGDSHPGSGQTLHPHRAIAAVDIALLGRPRKTLNQPVYKLLGGYRTSVPVIAIGGYLRKGSSLSTLEEEIIHYQEAENFGDEAEGGVAFRRGGHRARAPGPKSRRGKFHLCTDSNQAWKVEGGDALRPRSQGSGSRLAGRAGAVARPD